MHENNTTQIRRPRKILRPSNLLFLLPLAASVLFAQAVFANSTNAPAPPLVDNGGFSPGLFLIVIGTFLICLFLVGFGLAIGIILCALAAALATFGILSSSVMIGFLRRSPACGLRALFLQIGAAAGIPCGMAAMWLTASLADIPWSTERRICIGGASGLVCGIVVALIFNFAWGRTAGWLLKKYDVGNNP